MKKLTLLSAVFAVFLLAGCENPIYQWLLPEKKDTPTGPLDINKGWDSSQGQGMYMFNLRAQGGDTTVTLSWTNPSSKDFHHVEIYYSDSYSDVQSAALSCTRKPTADQSERYKIIDGLTNDTPYYFAVTPMNGQGEALGQALIISATPRGGDDPDRPDDVEGLGGSSASGQISLSWKLPSRGTGEDALPAKKITDVVVSIVPQEGTVQVTANKLGAVASGLLNGKPYTLYIRTVNAAGKKSYGVSTVQIPSAVGGGSSGDNSQEGLSSNTKLVRNLQAIPSNKSVKLLWDDPIDNFDNLHIYVSRGEDSFELLQREVPAPGDAVPVANRLPAARELQGDLLPDAYTTAVKGEGIAGRVIPDLENDKIHFFAIFPVLGARVVDLPIIISATPSEPKEGAAADVEGLYGTPGDGQVRLQWDFPLPAGVTGIDVKVRPAVGTEVIVYEGMSGAIVKGLTNGDAYNFTVKTTNKPPPPPPEQFTYTDYNSMGRSLALIPLEQAAIPDPGSGAGGGGGSSMNLKLQVTNIKISGDYLYNADPNIPVVAYFTDGTWYDGHISDAGLVMLNYPETRPFERRFASLYLVRDRQIVYLGREWDGTKIELNISGNGVLQFRAPCEDNYGKYYIPIETAGELIRINLDANSLEGKIDGKTYYYKQMRDLNLLGKQPGMEDYRVLNWEPVGSGTMPFKGVYDGDGKAIEFLYISAAADGAGLFGYTESGADGNGGELKNIIVKTGRVAGGNFRSISALCGENGGKILNCYNYIAVEGASGSSEVGGLAGSNYGRIESSYNGGAVYSGGSDIGGIAGSNRQGGIIKDCENNGRIGRLETRILNVGGIAGFQEGSIEGCINNGEVSAGQQAGGIAGLSNGTIEGSTNRSTVRAASWDAGGVAGYNITGTIKSCTNEGAVIGTGGGGNIGGVCGTNMGGKIKNSFNTGAVNGKIVVGGVAGGNLYSYRGAPMPEITACYNAGEVTGTGWAIGGVCGNNQGYITASYNTKEVSGHEQVGGVAGLNSAIHYDFGYKRVDDAINFVGPPVNAQTPSYYAATVSACYNTGVVTGSAKVGGIIGQNNTEASLFYINIGNGTTSKEGNDNIPGKYFEGLVKDSYWLPSSIPQTAGAGIGHIEGQGPVLTPADNRGGCFEFSSSRWPTSNLPNWGPDYWASLGSYQSSYPTLKP